MKLAFLLLFTLMLVLKVIAQNAQALLPKDEFPSFSQEWELNKEDKKQTFRISSYKPIFEAQRWTNNPNRQPYSENPDYSVLDAKPYNNYEALLQLSLKTKVFESFIFGYGDLWVGYTQVAHWQIYNTELSRPFRELNYEPEIILNFPLKVKLLGFDLRMASVGFNHQSNGRELPRSRSWNRIMFNIVMQRKNLQINLKPWIRLKDEIDENPLITDYIGRGEAIFKYKLNKHSFNLIATNSLNFNNNHGSLQFSYLYPIKENFKAAIQIFNGYGETLIDYNHKQTTIGMAIVFNDW